MMMIVTTGAPYDSDGDANDETSGAVDAARHIADSPESPDPDC